MSRIVLGLLALCLLQIYVDAGLIKTEECGNNMTLKPCGRVCEPTCKDQRIKLCKVDIEKCPLECTCEKGFVRHTRKNKCIKADKCPTKKCRAIKR